MDDTRRIERFLYREARLMDAHAYEEWLALWDETASYWIPCNDDDYDFQTRVSLVHENYEGLEDRIARLTSGAVYAQEPKSRLSRVVSNVEIAQAGDDILVESTFNLTASRKSRIDIIAGRVWHKLRPVGDDFRILSKKVILVDNDEVINNITFLI